MASLEETVQALKDLVIPVDLIKLSANSDSYVFQTQKGVNILNTINSEKYETLKRYAEDLTLYIDRQVSENVKNDSLADNSIPINMTSIPDWFNKLPNAFYILEDLSANLHPNRKTVLLDPILYGIKMENEELITLTKELEINLNQECCNNQSCSYRKYFPAVGKAGPVALSYLIIMALTSWHLFISSTEAEIYSFLKIINDALSLSSSKNNICIPNNINMCICCILDRQTKSYMDIKNNIMVSIDNNDRIEMCTLLGIKKFMKGVTVNEMNHFAPIIKIDGHENYYTVDKCCFSEYEIKYIETLQQWCVIRSQKENDSTNINVI